MCADPACLVVVGCSAAPQFCAEEETRAAERCVCVWLCVCVCVCVLVCVCVCVCVCHATPVPTCEGANRRDRKVNARERVQSILRRIIKQTVKTKVSGAQLPVSS